MFCMIFKRLIVFSYLLSLGHGLWDFTAITSLLSRSQNDADCSENFDGKATKNLCDENKLLLQLARLYITSPERIVLLLAANSLEDTCEDILNVLQRLNTTQTACDPLPSANLYVKLQRSLEYFYSFVCEHDENSRKKHINNYHDCLRELREDLIDCEGPPDWFEKKNKTIVCQYFNDIINCNYIKAALLCGLTPALLLRTFSNEVFKKVIPFRCKVSRSLPYVEDPMPSVANQQPSVNPTIIIFIYLYLYIMLYFIE